MIWARGALLVVIIQQFPSLVLNAVLLQLLQALLGIILPGPWARSSPLVIREPLRLRLFNRFPSGRPARTICPWSWLVACLLADSPSSLHGVAGFGPTLLLVGAGPWFVDFAGVIGVGVLADGLADVVLIRVPQEPSLSLVFSWSRSTVFSIFVPWRLLKRVVDLPL